MKKYILLSILIVVGLLIVPMVSATGPPTANFEKYIVNQTTIGTGVEFNSTFSAGITNWNWVFGDGHVYSSNSNTTSSNIYATNGNYIVSLTVTNLLLDTQTFTYTETIAIPAITNTFGDVFVGEEKLDVSTAMGTSDYIGWWASGSDPRSTSSDSQIGLIGRKSSLTISQAEFATHLGKWYALDSGYRPISVAFTVVDPYLELQLWNADANIEITNGKIARGTKVRFKIDTNMYAFPNRVIKPTPISIRVISSNGGEYTKLSGSDISLRCITLTSQPAFWEGFWVTDAKESGVYAFDSGEYRIYAESDLNGIRNNYDRVGKTISTTKKLSIIDDSLSMSINKESIIRGGTFAVSIVGKPNSIYHLWVTKTSSMGETLLTPPKIRSDQEGVDIGKGGNHISSGIEIKSDTPITVNPSPFYANVTTGTDGVRTVSFSTSLNTTDKKYIIRVESDTNTEPKYDEVQISIGNGGMSIVAAGGPSYYLGELITLSGINTESSTTYLYIYGPNLNTEGVQMHKLDPRNWSVINDDPSTFKQVQTNGDGSWSWDWSTSSMSLDAGTYIIYAVSQPKSRSHLLDAAYATASVSFGKPTLSATVNQKSIAKGDTLRISGFAEGNPGNVAIWIMGKNYATRDTVSVDDAEFYYDLDRVKTSNMASGQYYVLIQHPMQNGKFDVYLNSDGSITNSMLGINGIKIFQFSGAGSLQGTDAANALINAIDDVNIDDMYTKLQFVVADPYITIDDIGMIYIGERITIGGRTNLAADTSLLIDINPLTFRPTNKSNSNLFTSSAIMTVPVVKGDNTNTFSAIVDFSTFKPDEYLITASAVGNEIVDTSTFIISSDVRPAAPKAVTTPKVNVTMIAPTVIPTLAPIPTPTPTPTNKPLPGYGAILALTGLIIVSAIIMRRK